MSIDEEHFPDKVFRNYVSKDIDKDHDLILSYEEIQNTKEIILKGQQTDGGTLPEYGVSYKVKLPSVYSFKGIEYFPELISFDCSVNGLTELDLKNKTKLEE